MSGAVNKVILVGNLGKDPESRTMQNGGVVVTLTLATGETWNDKATGERKERTEWHRIVIFNEHLVDVAERFLRKGRKVYVEGCLRTRKWTDQQGQDRYTTEVVLERFRGELTLLDSKRDDADDGYDAGGEQQPRASAPRREPAMAGGARSPSWDAPHGGGTGGLPSGAGDLDDEIPFAVCRD